MNTSLNTNRRLCWRAHSAAECVCVCVCACVCYSVFEPLFSCNLQSYVSVVMKQQQAVKKLQLTGADRNIHKVKTKGKHSKHVVTADEQFWTFFNTHASLNLYHGLVQNVWKKDFDWICSKVTADHQNTVVPSLIDELKHEMSDPWSTTRVHVSTMKTHTHTHTHFSKVSEVILCLLFCQFSLSDILFFEETTEMLIQLLFFP